MTGVILQLARGPNNLLPSNHRRTAFFFSFVSYFFLLDFFFIIVFVAYFVVGSNAVSSFKIISDIFITYRKLGTHGVEGQRTAQNKCHWHSRIDHVLTCTEVSLENERILYFVNIKTGIVETNWYIYTYIHTYLQYIHAHVMH